jgi:DNA mismatch endonuclease (patch repair protein)
MDTLSPAERSERMGRVKGKDSRAELTVRRLVHRLGYRYRLHGPGLPGRPDLVFHGCFWHRHPDPNCRLARLPKSRQDFWLAKLDSNRLRDDRVARELVDLGWSSLVIWECGLRDEASLENNIRTFLES